MPLAVKDLFCVEECRAWPARASSRATGRPTPRHGVERLWQPGAPVLGKTNQDEFAMGSSNENSGFGPTRTRGTAARAGRLVRRVAAAVAAGTAPWAIGTDTGGSIRQPASLCGIVGPQAHLRRRLRYGMIAFASSLDQCGPLTRDVTDAALLLAHIRAAIRCDSTSLGIPGGVALPTAERLDGLRFGVWGMDGEGLEPAWRR